MIDLAGAPVAELMALSTALHSELLGIVYMYGICSC